MDLAETNASEGEWYDDIKYALVSRELKDLTLDDVKIVDVGSGQGGILRRVRSDHPSSELRGIDPFLNDELIERLASDGIYATRESDFATHSGADILLLMDVLEHVENPGALLAESLELLSDGGTAVITVPAYRWLWSSHDVALGHFDRYTVPRLRALVNSAAPGYAIVRTGYAFPTLLLGAAPARLIERLLRRGKAPSKEGSQLDAVSDGPLSQILRRLGLADAAIWRGHAVMGLTCVALVRRQVSSGG